MGFNTTVIVLNDALSDIERDPEFGKKLAAAIRHIGAYCPKGGVNISARGHVNAATVVETHHADSNTIVVVGGNQATQIGFSFGDHDPEHVMRALAAQLGFVVRKK